MSKKSRDAIRNNLERAIAPPTRKRSSHLDGLLDEYAPPEDSSPSPNVSHASQSNYALRGVSHAPRGSHAPNVGLEVKSSDLWASVPETKGYSKQFHAITDHLFRLLDTFEQAVYTQLFRLTHGFGKQTCIIALPKLAERAGIGTTAAHAATKRLVAKGLVEKRTWIVGKGKEQGIEFSLPLPAWLTPDASLTRNVSHTSNEPIKETHIKETHTNTEPVSVGSRFALSDCRKYAEHLKATGQGITNPGGYATKIHRSGEADELIERFLAPAQASVDASQCPDCKGTGFYYPNGMSGGVVKCKHEQLAQR
jgi:hypothetical protein